MLHASDLFVNINWNMGHSWNLELCPDQPIVGRSVPYIYITCARTLGCVDVVLSIVGRRKGGKRRGKRGEKGQL